MKRFHADISMPDLLTSLAEVVRLRIMRLLEAEELSVGEVAKVVQLPQSTVSRHLKVLSDAGWLTRRAAGPATLYRLILDDLAQPARSLWLTVRSQLTDTPDLQEDMRRLQAILAERRLDSQAFFGRIAGEWDAVRARLFGGGGGGADFTSRALLSLIPPHWTIADLGCGTGNASELLAPIAQRIIAVDQSEPMLAAARQRLEGIDNVEFKAGPLESLPLADASVDASVCMLVMHHVAQPVEALREMKRILRAGRGGGTAIIVDMIEHDREEYRQTMGHTHLGFAPARMEQMLTQAGFASARVLVLPSDPAALGPGLFVAIGTIPGA